VVDNSIVLLDFSPRQYRLRIAVRENRKQTMLLCLAETNHVSINRASYNSICFLLEANLQIVECNINLNKNINFSLLIMSLFIVLLILVVNAMSIITKSINALLQGNIWSVKLHYHWNRERTWFYALLKFAESWDVWSQKGWMT